MVSEYLSHLFYRPVAETVSTFPRKTIAEVKNKIIKVECDAEIGIAEECTSFEDSRCRVYRRRRVNNKCFILTANKKAPSSLLFLNEEFLCTLYFFTSSSSLQLSNSIIIGLIYPIFPTSNIYCK